MPIRLSGSQLIRVLAMLFIVSVVLNVPASQLPAQASRPGSFLQVEGGKIYYEECGAGDEAVLLVHDGVVHSAVWDEVWPLSVRGSTRSATTGADMGGLPSQPLGIRKPTTSSRSFAT